MATLTVNGTSVTVDDSFLKLPKDKQEATINEIAAKVAAQKGKGGVNEAPPQSQSKIDPDTLQYDKRWLDSARQWYKFNTGKDFTGTNAELADEGMSSMRWFNNNTVSMTKTAANLRTASPETKQAFLYLMDTFDQTDWTWGGVAGAAGMQLVDPANFATGAAAFFTGGAAVPAEQAAIQATKMGIRQMIKAGVKAGVRAGAENAVISGVQNTIQQEARVEAGGQDSIDFGEVGKATAVGFGGGLVLGGAIGTGSAAIAARKAGKVATEAGDAAARGIIQEADTAAADVARDIAKDNTPSNFTSEVPHSAPDAYTSVSPNEAPLGSVSHSVDDLSARADTPLVKEGDPLITSPDEAPRIDTPSEGANIGDQIIEAVKKVSDPEGGIFHTSKDALSEASVRAVELLKNLGINSVRDVTEALRRVGLNDSQTQVLKNAVMEAGHALTVEIPAKLGTELTDHQVAALADVQHIIAKLDEHFAANSARDLGNRADNTILTKDNKALGLTVPDVLAELKLDNTPENVRHALGVVGERVKAVQEQIQKASAVRKLETQISQAFAAGDHEAAARLGSERSALIKASEKAAIDSLPFSTRMKNALRRSADMAATWVQSVLLGTDSFIRNVIPSVVKTIYKPFLNAVSKGFGEAARAEMAMTYHSLWRVKGEAARAAIAYWRYSQDAMSHNPNKFLENQNAIPGRVGSIPIHNIVTFFPRAMGAVDQFFRSAHYRSFIEGQAVADAISKAKSLGIKGAERDRLIAKNVQDALKNSFDTHVDSVHTVDFLREQGVRRGYTGEALDKWIAAELEKNADLFRHASNQTGLDYVNDLLFSRTLSGDGWVSSLVKGYQSHIQSNPFAKILLNPYFLTPVRVFEEGLRMTPLVQLITPHFIADLRGLRGADRQARAVGEMMMGQALTMSVFYKYAAGEITGAGPQDPKERKAWLAAGNKPYTIKMGDSEYAYRSLDPFSTPFKIIVNALDRYRSLEAADARGEFNSSETVAAFGNEINKGSIDKVMATIGVGTLAVGQAINDTGMLEGFAQIVEAGQAIMNPQDNEDPMLKLVMDKAKVFVPRMISKTNTVEGDGITRTPRTFDQYLIAMTNPASEQLPAQYDAMGVRRTNGLGVWSLFGVDKITQSAEDKSITPQQRDIAKTLQDITISTGKDFSLPVNPSFEGLTFGKDLRTIYVPGTGKTMYDRYGEIYRSLPVAEKLSAVIAQGGTIGTKEQDGELTMRVTAVVTAYRQKAFAQLFQEVTGIKEKYQESLRRKQADFFGAHETELKPY